MKRLLLFSGGLDSYIAWHLLDKPTPIYFRLGHRYQEAEMTTMDRLEAENPGLQVKRDDRLYLGDKELPDAHLPLRNALLLTTAAAVYQPDIIYIGALRGESSRDKSRRFFRNTGKQLSFLLGQRLVVQAPFIGHTKTDLVKAFLKKYPEGGDALRLTFSCYTYTIPHSRFKGCGRCMACFRRWVALSLNGIDETYAQNPWEWEQISALNWQAGLRAILKADRQEWGNILVNNAQALRALRLQKHEISWSTRRPF